MLVAYSNILYRNNPVDVLLDFLDLSGESWPRTMVTFKWPTNLFAPTSQITKQGQTFSLPKLTNVWNIIHAFLASKAIWLWVGWGLQFDLGGVPSCQPLQQRKPAAKAEVRESFIKSLNRRGVTFSEELGIAHSMGKLLRGFGGVNPELEEFKGVLITYCISNVATGDRLSPIHPIQWIQLPLDSLDGRDY